VRPQRSPRENPNGRRAARDDVVEVLASPARAGLQIAGVAVRIRAGSSHPRRGCARASEHALVEATVNPPGEVFAVLVTADKSSAKTMKPGLSRLDREKSALG